MKLWKQLRIPLLALTFANIVLVFGRSLFDPNVGKRQLPPFDFPAQVPLQSWQQVSSQALPNKVVEQPPFGQIVLPGRQYRYSDNQKLLDISMRYEVETVGDVQQSLSNYANIHLALRKTKPVIRQHPQVGFYGLFVDQQRAYLDACINSRGGSTFTVDQFAANRRQYDMQFTRLLPWLIGQQGLRDNRCLWTHLSIPLKQSNPQSAYAILEQAWFDWYQWWQPRFPPL